MNRERASNSFLQSVLSVLMLTDCLSGIYCGCCVEEMGETSPKTSFGYFQADQAVPFLSRMSFNTLKNSGFFSLT